MNANKTQAVAVPALADAQTGLAAHGTAVVPAVMRDHTTHALHDGLDLRHRLKLHTHTLYMSPTFDI